MSDEPRPLTSVVASCNFQYDALWRGQRNLTPRIDTAFMSAEPAPTPTPAVPPPEIGFRPALEAKPLYMHRIGEAMSVVPIVTDKHEKFLRPTLSPMLGPHAYLLAGEITACDRYEHKPPQGGEAAPEGLWCADFVVDCGLPLRFGFGGRATTRRESVPQFWVRSVKRGNRTYGQDVEAGMWVAGLIELECTPFVFGLHQRVKATVRRMQVLGLNPAEDGFGIVHDVPYGYETRLDPFLFDRPYAFVTLEVTEVEPPAYKPFPARAPEFPEPRLS